MRYGTAGDVNFGLFLTAWDHLLGTAFDAPGYRLQQRDLGIGSQPDYPRDYPGSCWHRSANCRMARCRSCRKACAGAND
jgi:hypothetical protein